MWYGEIGDDTLDRLILDGVTLQRTVLDLGDAVSAIDSKGERITKLQLYLTLSQLVTVRRQLDDLIDTIGQVVEDQSYLEDRTNERGNQEVPAELRDKPLNPIDFR